MPLINEHRNIRVIAYSQKGKFDPKDFPDFRSWFLFSTKIIESDKFPSITFAFDYFSWANVITWLLIRRWLPILERHSDDKNDQLFTIRYEAAVAPSCTPPAFLTLAFPNEEAIILRDVSNGRGTMNPVTTFCPGWWLKANDPPPSFFPFALVRSLLSLNLPPALPFFLLSFGPSLIRGGREFGRWFDFQWVRFISFDFWIVGSWGEEFWKREINREICKIEKLKVCFK